MKVLKCSLLMLFALLLMASCTPPAPIQNTTPEMKPAVQQDMLLSDLIPDEQLYALQQMVWPKEAQRVVIDDKAAYDALLEQKSSESRFLSYEALKDLGDFVSYVPSSGDPNQEGFLNPNYAYTFHDTTLDLVWTLYVIEGQPPMPNETYQPTQDLFYKFLDLYKDNYAEDMRTQNIGDVSNVVEVRHGDVLYFYQNQNGKGQCKAILWDNGGRAFLAVGDFGAVDSTKDPQATHLITQLLSKSKSQAAAMGFMAK